MQLGPQQVPTNNSLVELQAMLMSRKQSGKYPVASGSDFIPIEVYTVAHNSLESSLSFSSPCEIRKKSNMNLKMLQLFTSSKGKETGKSMITKEASPCFHHRGNHCQDLAELSNTIPQTGFPARESVSFLTEVWNCWHGICCGVVAREVPRTECQPLHHLHAPQKGIWHCQPWWTV